MLALLFLSPRQINPRFHRIHVVIVLGLTTAAVMLAWTRAGSEFFVGIGIAVGACLAGSVLWTGQANAAAIASALFAAGGLLLALANLHALEAGSGPLTAFTLLAWCVDDLASAAVIGLATTAMLVGHWYLIAPTMAIDPLLRLIYALAGAVALRILTAVGDFGSFPLGEIPLDATAWLWLGLRWGVGFVGLGILTVLAWQTARIRSTQSATGILYVVTIFGFFGELTAQLLQEHLRQLQGM